jgi:hypothetical protein
MSADQLRDSLAMAAITGILSNLQISERLEGFPKGAPLDVVAKAAYEVADAMMKARGK